MAGLDHDTDMGGPQGRFPITHRSAVQATRSGDPGERKRAVETLVASYWKPAYKYLRLKWNASNEEAKDLTQGFFADAIERGLFGRYEPAKASFRTWLRTCLDGFVANQRRDGRRLKRGGGRTLLSLDFDVAEQEFVQHRPSGTLDNEAYFNREWMRSVFEQAVKSLRSVCESHGKTVHFQLFERYDLRGDDPAAAKLSYEQLAGEHGVSVTQVTNYLAWARREFRRLILEKLRELTDDDAEFRDEARRLLGDDRP